MNIEPDELAIRYESLINRSRAGTLTPDDSARLQFFGGWLGRDVRRDVEAARQGNRLVSRQTHCQSHGTHRHGTNRVADGVETVKTSDAPESFLQPLAGNGGQGGKP